MYKMRALILFVLLTLPSVTADAAPQVQFKSSEVFSLWYFAGAVQSDSHKAPELRELFRERADESERQAAIAFDKALAAAPSKLQYPEFHMRPPGRSYDVTISGMLEAHAGEADSLDDLAARIDGLLPPESQAALVEALRELEGLHREAVWKPSRAMTKRAIQQLEKGAEQTDFSARLQMAAVFYETEWPESVPFRVYVAPMPMKSEYGRAHANGTTAVILAAPNIDPERMLGVVFHEFCHALWKHQDPFRQRYIAKALQRHPLRSASRAAGGLLNEALATALGNGWFRRYQYGDEVMKAQWYADETVSEFAKLIYPMVEDYVTRGAAIDPTFINYAVALFTWKFGETLDDPATLFRRVLVFTDGRVASASDVLQDVGERFHTPYHLAAEPIGHPRTQMRYHQKRWTTLFAMGAPDPVLDDYEPGFAAAYAKLWDEGVPFAHLMHGVDGRLIVLIGARTDAEVTQLVADIAELERFESGMTLRP